MVLSVAEVVLVGFSYHCKTTLQSGNRLLRCSRLFLAGGFFGALFWRILFLFLPKQCFVNHAEGLAEFLIRSELTVESIVDYCMAVDFDENACPDVFFPVCQHVHSLMHNVT
jgi:hypothetical protein